MTPFTIPYTFHFPSLDTYPSKVNFYGTTINPSTFFIFQSFGSSPPFFLFLPLPFCLFPSFLSPFPFFYDDGKKWEIFSWKLFSLSAKNPSLGLLLFNSWEFFAACSLQAPSLSIFVTVVWGIVFFCRLYNFSKVFLSWTLTHKSCLPYAKLGAFVLETSGWQPPPLSILFSW